ncbi:hypothetical protein L3Y34_001145 [Caenorhabditis briggsae]|uniref:Uncharacterized protein n=1 Tax=Caenorhabditis briggsae TaxID=6238 RepID=A0AAE9DBN5_CAEBR|nr:hypothetical protein L3Y34_001145 [Caenorhabditis briggsae]
MDEHPKHSRHRHSEPTNGATQNLFLAEKYYPEKPWLPIITKAINSDFRNVYDIFHDSIEIMKRTLDCSETMDERNGRILNFLTDFNDSIQTEMNAEKKLKNCREHLKTANTVVLQSNKHPGQNFMTQRNEEMVPTILNLEDEDEVVPSSSASESTEIDRGTYLDKQQDMVTSKLSFLDEFTQFNDRIEMDLTKIIDVKSKKSALESVADPSKLDSHQQSLQKDITPQEDNEFSKRDELNNGISGAVAKEIQKEPCLEVDPTTSTGMIDQPKQDQILEEIQQPRTDSTVTEQITSAINELNKKCSEQQMLKSQDPAVESNLPSSSSSAVCDNSERRTFKRRAEESSNDESKLMEDRNEATFSSRRPQRARKAPIQFEIKSNIRDYSNRDHSRKRNVKKVSESTPTPLPQEPESISAPVVPTTENSSEVSPPDTSTGSHQDGKAESSEPPVALNSELYKNATPQVKPTPNKRRDRKRKSKKETVGNGETTMKRNVPSLPQSYNAGTVPLDTELPAPMSQPLPSSTIPHYPEWQRYQYNQPANGMSTSTIQQYPHNWDQNYYSQSPQQPSTSNQLGTIDNFDCISHAAALVDPDFGAGPDSFSGNFPTFTDYLKHL